MKVKVLVLLSILVFGFNVSVRAETKVVLLGTGTPIPDYKRAGAGTAVIYNGEAYIFDIGGGVVRRAIEASQKLGIKALAPTKIKHLFVTHLHSDHIVDYPELVATMWWRRTSQINVYGPKGIKGMDDGYQKFLATDTDLRINGIQPIKNPTFYQAKINEYDKDWVFKDGDVTIEAFKVPHGEIKNAFGYKITTPDKTIVISGDTRYSKKLIEMSKGADVLVHEVISEEGLNQLPSFWQKYHRSYHTTTSELVKVANEAKPGVLVLTHILAYKAPMDSALKEIKTKYDGKVVLGNDLDIF